MTARRRRLALLELEPRNQPALLGLSLSLPLDVGAVNLNVPNLVSISVTPTNAATTTGAIQPSLLPTISLAPVLTRFRSPDLFWNRLRRRW